MVLETEHSISKMLSFKIVILGITCAYAATNDPSGLYAPVFTPYDKNLAINVSVVPAYAKLLKSRGVVGVVVSDLSGEARSLSIDEKKKLLDAWVIAAKPLGLYVVAQVGGVPVPDVLELARYAATIRVYSILALPPACYSGTTVEELVTYIELIGKASKTVPVYYYHYPKVTGVIVDIPTFFEKATNKVALFKGIKTELAVAMQIVAVCKLRPDQDIVIFNYLGVAGAALMGFDTVCYAEANFVPRLINDIITYTEAGEVSKARNSQERLNRIAGGIKAQGDHVPVLKTATEIVTGIQLGSVRFPMEAVSKRVVKKVADILEDEDVSTAG